MASNELAEEGAVGEEDQKELGEAVLDWHCWIRLMLLVRSLTRLVKQIEMYSCFHLHLQVIW